MRIAEEFLLGRLSRNVAKQTRHDVRFERLEHALAHGSRRLPSRGGSFQLPLPTVFAAERRTQVAPGFSPCHYPHLTCQSCVRFTVLLGILFRRRKFLRCEREPSVDRARIYS